MRFSYDEQHDSFLKVQADMKDIKLAAEHTIKCMEMLVNQNVQVADKFQAMFPSGGQFVAVGTVSQHTRILCCTI